ncbi:MAG: ArsR/SmtB family transcription factor [Patescibacteria group bacterium]
MGSYDIKHLSSFLKLVGEESRLKILYVLKDGETCVCKIVEALPLSQSLVSHHLKNLKDAGLVQDRKQGLWVHYSLTNKGKSITNLLFSLLEGEKL